ncbi:class I SAM-dependent methyltransferase [Streptobacillus canis]|uniref:class I SAM-dependent methyltransferase n=1 Tax=Streptobacillus canis TaxID=2678686 RepID=UPI0012E21E9C|nr:class I SAM-dependent methyltransferase [Streptobacillus canis]
MTLEKSYNKIPYSSKAFEKTQPYFLRNIMNILSFETPDIKKARVLEIGCSFGGNILPIALNFPETEVVGIDLSSVQINKGNEIIRKIGLTNIRLINQNILEYSNDLGKFDYIICHGVFSWVPEIVAEKILDVIKENLTENGVALISYNTYPGWAKYDVYKNLMKFRVDFLNENGAEISDVDKINYGRGALEFLEKYSHLPKEFKESIKSVIDKDDYYLLHEYFEEYNKPMYLYEFNNMLLKKDLFHVTDANLALTFKLPKDNEALSLIDKECGDNLLAKEQYYDYMYNTQFRSSIITHKNNKGKINLSESFNRKNLEKLYISGNFLFENGQYSIRNSKFSVVNKKIEKLIKHLTKIYPANISIEEILKKYGDDLLKEILHLILLNAIEIFPYKIDKKDSLLNINGLISKYLNVSFEESNAIKISNYRGQVCEINEYLIRVIDKILKLEKFEEPSDIIVKMLKEKELTVNVDESEYMKIVDNILKEVKQVLDFFLI